MKSSVKCNCMTSLCCSRMRGCSETICLIDTAPIKTFPRPSLPFPELFSAPKTFSDPANPHRGAWGCNPSPPRKGAFSPRYLKAFQVPTLVISCFSYLYRSTTWNTKSVFNSPKIFPVNPFHSSFSAWGGLCCCAGIKCTLPGSVSPRWRWTLNILHGRTWQQTPVHDTAGEVLCTCTGSQMHQISGRPQADRGALLVLLPLPIAPVPLL